MQVAIELCSVQAAMSWGHAQGFWPVSITTLLLWFSLGQWTVSLGAWSFHITEGQDRNLDFFQIPEIKTFFVFFLVPLALG